MEYFEDYYLRLVHEMVRTILKLLFNIDTADANKELEKSKEQKEKYDMLIALAKEGKINESENMLYEEGFIGNKDDLKIGILFYDYVVGLNDEFLEMHNYSKKEAYEGLEMLLKKNGYDDIENIL